VFFFSSRRRHTRSKRDWSSDVCSSDLSEGPNGRCTWGIADTPRSTVARLAAGATRPTRYGEPLVGLVGLTMWARPPPVNAAPLEIGRASCRERGERGGGGGACA